MSTEQMSWDKRRAERAAAVKSAKTIANRPGGYLEFAEQLDREEEEKFNKIVSEQNQTLREIEKQRRLLAVREERRRLQREETPEIYQVVPRMSADQIPQGMTSEQVTAAIAEAVKQFRSKIEISKADWAFLCNVMQANEVNAMDVTVWELVLDWSCKRLQLLELGGPIPTPVEAPKVKPEDVNPYRYDESPRSAYATFEREKTNKQLWAELVVPVREWLTEIVQFDSKDLSAENIEALMKVMKARNIPFSRETVRRQFLDLWGVEMNETSRREAFSREELSAWETDQIDSKLSSDQLKQKYRNKVGF